MKYTDLTIEKARKICRNHIHIGKPVCSECPLRRTRNKNGKEIPLFCWFELHRMLEGIKEDIDELELEEVQHPEELRKELEKLNG